MTIDQPPTQLNPSPEVPEEPDVPFVPEVPEEPDVPEEPVVPVTVTEIFPPPTSVTDAFVNVIPVTFETVVAPSPT